MTSDRNRRDASRFWPVDWIVFGYCMLMVVAVVALGRPLSRYLGVLIFYSGAGALTALIVHFADETRGRWHSFLRLLYPALLFMFFYRATGGHMFLIFDRFFDDQVIALETSLFGIEPTILIDRSLPNVLLTELFSLCYFSYYLMLPGFLVPAFIQKKSTIIREYLAAVCLTFFVSYLLFWLYPVEGPRWHLAAEYSHSVDGPLFTRLAMFVIDNAAVRGGAMPSSHTGVALVTLIFCFRYYRRAAWWLLPIVAGLALGTVWGRFHYASDVVVGAAIGAGAVWLVWTKIHAAPQLRESVFTSPVARSQNVP